jgi:hypothetical protein
MNLRRLLVNRNLMIGAGAAILAVGASVAVVVALAMSNGSGDTTAVAPTPSTTPQPPPSPSPVPSTTPRPSPTLPPTVPGTDASDRIVIEKANVDAPITLKTVPPSGGELPSPLGPDDVVYYDFRGFPGLGGFPGSGGTIVMSGHVDYGGGYCDNGTEPPPCTAVFWDLTQLDDGDVIELHLPNGVHRYRINGSENLGAEDQEKWDAVWQAPAIGERIALITCGGDFNRETHEYDKRHVVYGTRIEDET